MLGVEKYYDSLKKLLYIMVIKQAVIISREKKYGHCSDNVLL